MRDYYYLTELNKFPFPLTLDYVLHLGATGRLKMYTFVDSWAILHALETGETRGEEKFYLRLDLSSLAEIEKHYTYWASQPETVRERTSPLCSSVAVNIGFIDERVDGLITNDTPFFEEASAPSKVRLHDKSKEVVMCHSSEILCWGDDLKRLATEPDTLQQEPEQTTTANSEEPDTQSSDARSLTGALATGELPHLEALLRAWRTYWQNADRTDRSACPKKDDVKAWLMKEGLSAKNADAGATIIKPQWALDKGW
ncbi:hypothetical protein [Marinobacter halophilus]|uniref:Uncharacterized protein n=1 Tax=Marinobacter halophilus TaxID=1323740 RepID=A0A2T1KEZ1_9GAMM|nr:hypothetical protein [Marinobacter halophilus]PSF08608.1 hypothetical protein C7H08_07985 [Marinobacter halophilus]GGC62077.1 hypothetical protein GCM10011362_08220 [Marinobacter halophilus]